MSREGSGDNDDGFHRLPLDSTESAHAPFQRRSLTSPFPICTSLYQTDNDRNVLHNSPYPPESAYPDASHNDALRPTSSISAHYPGLDPRPGSGFTEPGARYQPSDSQHPLVDDDVNYYTRQHDAPADTGDLVHNLSGSPRVCPDGRTSDPVSRIVGSSGQQAASWPRPAATPNAPATEDAGGEAIQNENLAAPSSDHVGDGVGSSYWLRSRNCASCGPQDTSGNTQPRLSSPEAFGSPSIDPNLAYFGGITPNIGHHVAPSAPFPYYLRAAGCTPPALSPSSSERLVPYRDIPYPSSPEYQGAGHLAPLQLGRSISQRSSPYALGDGQSPSDSPLTGRSATSPFPGDHASPTESASASDSPSPYRSKVTTRPTRAAAESKRKHPAKFSCEICEESFTAKHNLTRHMRAHKGQKPFVCACGKTFTSQSDCTRHKKNSKNSSCSSLAE